MITKLTTAPKDETLEIVEINSGMTAKRRLNSMGVYINDILKKYNDAKWGPVLVENQSSNIAKIALGRKLAEKIIVKVNGVGNGE